MKVSKRLVAALVILAAVFVILRLGSDRGTKDEPLFPQFRAELAAKITIHGREVNTVLERQDDKWIVASEDSFPAEPGAVGNIFEKILTFSHKDRISSNPEKQALYQVDSTGIEVNIEGTDGTSIASFVIGKVGPDYQSTYVKDGTSDNVILAPSYLPPVFERGTRTWQDLTLYRFEPQEIVEIRITRPGETVVLERDQAAAWYISEPESAACDKNEVSRLVRLLSYLRADYVAGRAPVEGSGVDAPDSSLWFRTTGGVEEEVVFGNRDENKRTYLKRGASDLIYLMATPRVGSLIAGYARLREKETDS
jgi:hypothetical protein